LKPIVTIGICCRNSEILIRATLESINNQDFPHDLMQLVLVDDGSEDNTLSIVRNCVSRMDIQTKIMQTRWRGLGPSRNLILNNADGAYIVWVDADEILTKEYVRKQVLFMEQNPNVGITTGIVKLDPNNLILTLEHIPDNVNRVSFLKQKNFLWKTEKMPGTGAATYRVKALKQVGGFNELLTGVGEDQDAARKVRDAGWLIRLNNAEFVELHGGMKNFKDLWKKYIWYGKGCHKIYKRNRLLFSFPRMSPIAGIAAGFFYSLKAYRLFGQKKVFLLPIHYGIKLTAWMAGFISEQI
jgi:glycosyltransferase involved in cell wall biosynthesis